MRFELGGKYRGRGLGGDNGIVGVGKKLKM